MKKIILLVTIFICHSIIGHAQSGELDPNFGTSGIVTVPGGASSSAIQTDGKILVSGNNTISRYNTDGSLDYTFGNNGVQTTNFAIVSIALVSDGKIIAAGNTPQGPGIYITSIFVARFNSNGSADNTFNGNGLQITDFEPSGDAITISVAVQKDGKIMLAGQIHGGTPVLVRYNADGSMDNTFDGDGKLNTGLRTNGIGGNKLLLIQPDGKIIFSTAIEYNIAVLRFNTDGSLDNTFDGDGIKTIDVGGYSSNIALQDDGKILIAGTFINGEESERGCIARINADGSIDNSFSGDGKLFTDFGLNGLYAHCTSLAITDDDKIFIGGSATDENNNHYLALARYSSDGILDNSFNEDGIQLKQGAITINDLILFDHKLYALHYPTALARYLLEGKYVAITSPSSNSIFNAPATIDIKAPAFNPDATITKVEFYDGAILIYTDDTSPYTFTWTNVAIGNYVITAKASYNIGEPLTSNAVHVSVVKNQPPTISFQSPEDNASFEEHATVALTAQADDAHAGGAISKVEFFNGNTLLATVTSSPYTFLWGDVPVGNYTLTAKATDNTGLTASSVVHISVQKVVANCTGTICGTANETGNVVLTAPPGATIASITFASYGTPEGSCGSFKIGTCNSSVSKSQVETLALNQNSVSIPATNQLFGDPCPGSSKRLYIEAIWGASHHVSITDPVNGAVYGSSPTINLSANVCGPDAKKVDFYNGDKLLLSTTAPSFSGNWSKVSAGNYSIIAKSKDENGKVLATSLAVKISVVNCIGKICATVGEANNLVLAAPPGALISSITFASYGTPSGSCGSFQIGSCHAPASKVIVESYALNKNYVSIPATNQLFGDPCPGAPKQLSIEAVWVSAQKVVVSSPLTGEIFHAPTAITLSANVCGLDIETVDFYNGDKFILTTTAPSFSGQWLNVPIGVHSIIAKSKDKNGNIIATSDAVSISVMKGSGLTVKITHPVNRSRHSSPAYIELSADATDEDGTIQKVDFYNGNDLIFTETVAPYKRSGYVISEAGNYLLTAKATDNDGNVITSDAVLITVVPNGKPPTVRITHPLSHTNHIAPAYFELSAEATDVDGTIKKVDFYNGSDLIFTETVAPYQRKGYVINTPGKYSLTAKATDDSGNVTTSGIVYISVTPNTPEARNISSATSEDNNIIDFSNNSRANIKAQMGLRLTPNPANNILNIYITGLQKNKNAIVSVISSTGIVMQTKQLSTSTQTTQLNVSSLVSGMYIIKIISGDKILYRQFVKL